MVITCTLSSISTSGKWFDYVLANQYLHSQKLVWLLTR